MNQNPPNTQRSSGGAPLPALLVASLVVLIGALIVIALLSIASQRAAAPRQLQSQRDLAAEISTIRRLATACDPGDLAEALDRSVVLIPAGEFLMGDDNGGEHERPRRRVYLDAFEIDRYEVTNAQYRRFLLTTGTPPPVYWSGLDYPSGQADYPVAGVSWAQALAYCEWQGKSLPSEAQWEKACRGTHGADYPWGEAWDPLKANLGYPQMAAWPLSLEDGWELLRAAGGVPSEAPALQPVGSYPSDVSPFGVLDLAGSLSEWALDWYNWDGYQDMPLHNPLGLGPPWNHSLRGGSWFDRRGQGERLQEDTRCAARNSSHSYDDPRQGFRCACPLP